MEGLGISCIRHAPAVEEPGIDGNIDDDDHTGERELDSSGEAIRIEDGQEIMLNEALRVARFACHVPEMIFQVCEWAHAAGELNEGRPGGGWKMNGEYPSPPRSECSTQNGEEDERQMDQKDGAGSQMVEHDCARTMNDVLYVDCIA